MTDMLGQADIITFQLPGHLPPTDRSHLASYKEKHIATNLNRIPAKCVAHVFNPTTQEAEARRSEFEPALSTERVP